MRGPANPDGLRDGHGHGLGVGRALAGALVAVADLVWPTPCGGCGAPGRRWCEACAAWLDQPARPTCPSPCPTKLPAAWAVSPYDGPVRRAIISWKDEGRYDLTGPLALALSRSIAAALDAFAMGIATNDWATDRHGPVVLVVPMPSRRAARQARGTDAVRELAVRAAAQARLEGRAVRVAPALGHTRAVSDQARLTAAQRRANLTGALEVRPSWRRHLAGSPCLLVDDVITTGATLAEAAAAVARAGGLPFGVAVVAATQRTDGSHVTNFQVEG